MKEAIQLKIDLLCDNEQRINDLYEYIRHTLIPDVEGIEILDDGHAPYTEDLTDQYIQMGIIKPETETIVIPYEDMIENCFPKLSKLHDLFPLSADEGKELMLKLKEWSDDFPGDEWHGLSDRYDINGWFDNNTVHVAISVHREGTARSVDTSELIFSKIVNKSKEKVRS